jgi:hypothetical protein
MKKENIEMCFKKRKYKVNIESVYSEYSSFNNSSNTFTPSLKSRVTRSDYDSLTCTHGDYKEFNQAINNEISSIDTATAIRIHSLSEAWIKLLGILKTNGVNNAGEKVYFRGQTDKDWAINSSIVRSIYNKFGQDGLDYANQTMSDGKSRIEKVKFNEYMDIIKDSKTEQKMKEQGFIPPKFMNANWYAIMQHEGFETRFIDFTEDFLVALYFSCAEWESNEKNFEKKDIVGTPDKDGIVFIMGHKWLQVKFNRDEKDNPFLRMKDPKTLPGEQIHYIIEPEILHPRITKQRGVFLSSRYLFKDIKIDGYRLIIDKDSKESILEDLNILGINRSRLITDWKFNEKDAIKQYFEITKN